MRPTQTEDSVTVSPEPIAGNPAVDRTIRKCLGEIPVSVARVVERRLRSVATDDDGMHTFHELLIGAYLARCGWTVEYERLIDGKTPDWTLIEDGDARGIIDVVTYHLARSLEDYLKEMSAKRGTAAYWPENEQKMFGALDGKASNYDALATRRGIPFVVSIFTKFEVGASPDEIMQVLAGEGRIFEQRPALSGVLFAREETGKFGFTYFPNPTAALPIALPPERWSPR